MKTNLVLISVTEDDIKNGKRMDSKFCPIALACKRTEMFGEHGVRVDHFKLFKRGSCLKYRLPFVAKAFIHRFDAGRNVEPFEFEVDLNQAKVW